MTKKNFIWSCILTAMDILVFALCVDRGLSPIAIVGACYIALRCFGKDSQDAVNLAQPAMARFESWLRGQYSKLQERKEVETPEE